MKRQFALLLSVLMVFSLCACGKSHENMSKTPCNSKDMRGEAYEKAVEAFGNAGFTNVTTEKVEDLVLGWLNDEGDVDKITIDGSDDFDSGVWYPSGASVVIYYHTFPKKDEDTKDAYDQDEVTDEDDSSPITAETNTDFANLISTQYPSEEMLQSFYNKYRSRLIEYDCFISYKEYNKDRSKAGFLLWSGDYPGVAGEPFDYNMDYTGPQITIKDEDFKGLSTDLTIFDVNEGDNVHVTISLCPYVNGAHMYEATLFNISLR